MTVKVITSAFRRKHGHEPRGRFLWTFRIGTKQKLWIGDNGKAYALYHTSRGEYEESLAKAIRCAEEKGAADISVSSIVYGQDPGR